MNELTSKENVYGKYSQRNKNKTNEVLMSSKKLNLVSGVCTRKEDNLPGASINSFELLFSMIRRSKKDIKTYKPDAYHLHQLVYDFVKTKEDWIFLPKIS